MALTSCWNKWLRFFPSVFLILLPGIGPAAPLPAPALIHGRVLDIGGRPVAGGEVQAFDSADVRRPADFASGRSGKNGLYLLKLPPGRYWLVAVLRTNGREFGPLGVDDYHSGNPVIIEPEAGEDVEMDFTVLTLKEASRRKQRQSLELLRVSGRISDRDGKPLPMACVVADRRPRSSGIPAYVSRWSDENGNYLLFVPKGTFYLGASLGFPPESGYLLRNMATFNRDTAAFDLILTRDHSSVGKSVDAER